MVLLIDPYANGHLSMADIRLMNKVAGALAEAHDELDMSELAGAITSAYRPSMRAQALMMHIERDLQLEARRR